MKLLDLIRLVPVLAVLWAGCRSARLLSNAEIPASQNIKDVMWTQAELADPAFKKISAPIYTDADWVALIATGKRLQISSAKIKRDFSKGPDWNALADHLSNGASGLTTAAEARDGKAVTAALIATRNSCRACHKQFK